MTPFQDALVAINQAALFFSVYSLVHVLREAKQNRALVEKTIKLEDTARRAEAGCAECRAKVESKIEALERASSVGSNLHEVDQEGDSNDYNRAGRRG